jgi:hypothetical protein
MSERIIRRVAFVVIVIGISFILGWDTPNIFPLTEGAKWTYTGIYEESDAEGNTLTRTDISVEAKVLRFVNGGGYVAAYMNGYPKDALSFADGEGTLTTYVYFVLDSRVYMITDNTDMERALSGRYDPKPNDLFIALPPTPGPVPEPLIGEEGWVIEEQKITVPALRGTIDGFSILLQKDDRAEMLTFAPCVGVTSYQYYDYDSGKKIILRLSEVKIGY